MVLLTTQPENTKKATAAAERPKRPSLRRIAWQAALFAVYLLVLDRLLFILPVRPRTESQNPYLSKIEEYKALASTPDVLYMGSSRIWMGVIPSQIDARLAGEGLDVTGYNFGASATTPAVHYLFLRDVVLPKGKPRLIILEVAAREMNGRNGRSDKPMKYLTRMGDVPDFIGHARTFAEARDLVLSNLFVSSRRFSDIRAWIAGKKPEVVTPGGDDAVKMFHDDGWLEYTYTPPVTWEERKEYWRRAYAEEVLLDYSIEGIPDYAFRRFMELASEESIPVILVNIPITGEQMEFFHNNEYEMFLKYMADASREYGVPFLDYNVPRYRPDVSLFHDTHHLGAQGAQAFSRVIADEVVAPFFRGRDVRETAPGNGLKEATPD